MGYFTVEVDGVDPPCDMAAMSTVAAIVLAVIPDLEIGEVDAFSDCRSLPEEARTAQEQLRELDRRRRGAPGRRGWRRLLWGDTGATYLDVAVDLRDSAHRELFLAFAPYAISARARRAKDEEEVFGLDDSGASVTISVTEAERERLLEAFAVRGLTDTRLLPLGRT